MQIRFFKFWEELKSSYWFVPAVMAAGAILLSLGTVWLDEYFRAEVLRSLGFIWSGGAEGARGLLQSVAGSMITVAGVTFSITMVALSFASSQFGSRLLRNFMADTGNQIVLGTFIATFIYCLLVLRTVRSDGDTEFVPHLSVTLGLVLALASLIVLIYFFHHMALSMQAPYIIGEVAADLFKTIERLFPRDAHKYSLPDKDDGGSEADLPHVFTGSASMVKSDANGYMQALDEKELMKIACDQGLVLKLPTRPGDFIIKDDVLAYVWPADRLDDAVQHKIKPNFIIGKQRTHTQDVEFGIEQLVEVAERSLSSGINATFTAITCVDWLGAALAELSGKTFPSPHRYDAAGELRIFFERPLSLVGLIDAAFNPIRQSARNNVPVQIRMLEKIAVLRTRIRDPKAIHALERQARMIKSDAENNTTQRDDRKDVIKRYRRAVGAGESPEDSQPEDG